PAVAAALLDQKIDGDLRRVVRVVGVLEVVERPAPEHDPDDGLTVAGARHAADRAVGVGAATDQSAVADASWKLAGGAAGGRRGRNGAVPVERDGADRAAERGGSRRTLGVALSLAIRDERRGVALRDSHGPGERDGAVADEQDVTARLEDAPGEGDRVRDAGDGRNGAALEAVTFHDRRVQLDRAVSGEDRAAARVET